MKRMYTNEQAAHTERRLHLFTKPFSRCLIAMIACILWGSAIPVIKMSYQVFGIDTTNPGSLLLFAGIRFTIAGALVILFEAVGSRRIYPPKADEWKKILKVSCFQTILQYAFYYLALRYASGVSASILVGTNTFFSIFLAAGVLHMEKLTANKVFGCVVGFAGVVLSQSGGAMALSFSLKGEGMILISAACAGISAILIKRFGQTMEPMILSGWQFLIGGITLSLVGVIGGGHPGVMSFPAAGTLLYLAMVSAVAYTLWALLLQYNPVSKVTVFGFMTPVCGVVLSTLLLAEGGLLSVQTLLALALVSLGIYVVNR